MTLIELEYLRALDAVAETYNQYVRVRTRVYYYRKRQRHVETHEHEQNMYNIKARWYEAQNNLEKLQEQLDGITDFPEEDLMATFEYNSYTENKEKKDD